MNNILEPSVLMVVTGIGPALDAGLMLGRVILGVKNVTDILY